MTARANVHETPYCAAVERRLCDAKSQVRVDRINAGRIVVEGRTGTRSIRGAKAGTGDLVGWVIGEGWHIEIETKSATGKQRKKQIEREAIAARQGWIYVLARYRDEKTFEENVDRAVAMVDAAIHAKRHGAKWASMPEGCTA